jgi:hypothetical protein
MELQCLLEVSLYILGDKYVASRVRRATEPVQDGDTEQSTSRDNSPRSDKNDHQEERPDLLLNPLCSRAFPALQMDTI